MKKRILAAVLCGILIGGFAGCKNTAEKEKEVNPDSTVLADVTSNNELTGDISAGLTAPVRTINPTDSTPDTQIPEEIKSQGRAPVTEQTSETKSAAQTDKPNPVPFTPVPTESPKREPQPAEPPKPQSTEPAKPEESELPQETEKPTESPVPEFDINHWISYAKNYAEGIGLELDSEAVECWDNPITAGADCIYIQRDIESRLNRYNRDEDITAVWIWAEKRADGAYDIYIGYA